MIILLNNVQNFNHTYKINYWSDGLKILFKDHLLLKVDHFEGILIWNKIDKMVNDHSNSSSS